MKNTRKNKTRPARRPILRFTPTAWAKLLLLRDLGDTEVGGFGIAPSDDLLLIEDVQLVGQSCTAASVEFDDESVADFFDRQVDAGLKPEQFGRVWIHTHPANSADPSQTDEDTFLRVFGRSDWSVMFILAQGGQTYARLQFNQGLAASFELDVEIDFTQPFDSTDWDAWQAEYDQNVLADQYELVQPRWWAEEFGTEAFGVGEVPAAWRDAWHNYSDDEFQEIAHEQLTE